MNTSRMKYRRSLQVTGLIRLVLLGAITAGVAGAFVVVKNRQHDLANEKSALEDEIISTTKMIETLDSRIAMLTSRPEIEIRLDAMGYAGLVKIERTENVISDGQQGEQFASYRKPLIAREGS